MTSPRLLEDYFAATGLAGKLPGAALVGRNFRMHINSALIVFSTFRRSRCAAQDGDFSTTSIRIRPCSASAGSTASCSRRSCRQRRRIFHQHDRVARARLLRHDRGRIEPRQPGDFEPRQPADPRLRVRPHQTLAGRARGLRPRLRTWAPACRFSPEQAAGPGSPAPPTLSGPLVTGRDPARSVVDPHGKVHGMEGLYVSDGCVLPRPAGSSGLHHLCLGSASRRRTRRRELELEDKRFLDTQLQSAMRGVRTTSATILHRSRRVLHQLPHHLPVLHHRVGGVAGDDRRRAASQRQPALPARLRFPAQGVRGLVRHGGGHRHRDGVSVRHQLLRAGAEGGSIEGRLPATKSSIAFMLEAPLTNCPSRSTRRTGRRASPIRHPAIDLDQRDAPELSSVLLKREPDVFLKRRTDRFARGRPPSSDSGLASAMPTTRN